MKFLKIAMMAIVLAVAAGSVPAPAWADGDVAKGKKVFKKCKACHKLVVGKRAIGPSLHGIFGRTAGTSKGYKYTKDMKAAGAKGLVWDEKTLAEFLTKPKPSAHPAQCPRCGACEWRYSESFGWLCNACQPGEVV